MNLNELREFIAYGSVLWNYRGFRFRVRIQTIYVINSRRREATSRQLMPSIFKFCFVKTHYICDIYFMIYSETKPSTKPIETSVTWIETTAVSLSLFCSWHILKSRLWEIYKMVKLHDSYKRLLKIYTLSSNIIGTPLLASRFVPTHQNRHEIRFKVSKPL